MSENGRIPALFPWVAFRREAFGGLLFNPYVQKELTLDPFEARTVELLDGATPAALLAVDLARSAHTDRAAAGRRLAAVLDKLDHYFALRWNRPAAGQDVPAMAAAPRPAGTECGGPEMPGCLSAPLSILWEITHACNLRCLHCLSAGGKRLPDELSTTEGKALIDELAELKVFSFTVGGGEPLVRKDVFELIEHASAKDLGVRLTTNGFLVSDKTVDRLEDLNVFAVQVSVDGLRETHDLFRRRRGSFDRAVAALERFTEAGYTTFMTVTASALNLAEIPALVELAVEIGVSVFKVGPYVHLGRAVDNASRLRLSPQQIRDLAALMRHQRQLLGGQIDFQIEGLFPWLFEPSPGSPVRPDGCGPGCSAGTSQVVVSYDGNVYPCPYIRGRCAGNVRRASLASIWRNQEVFAPLRGLDRDQLGGKCRSCTYRPAFCRGGCRGAALAAHGDLYAEDPNCWLGEAAPETTTAARLLPIVA